MSLMMLELMVTPLLFIVSHCIFTIFDGEIRIDRQYLRLPVLAILLERWIAILASNLSIFPSSKNCAIQ